MLIAIGSSQGAGKTTLLNELKKNNYNIIERKTSRSILSDWGVTLSQVNNDHKLTIEFQDEIIRRKYQDEMEAIESSDLWFTERSYADLFVYSVVSLGKDNVFSVWLNSYYDQCKSLQEHYYHVCYLTAGHFVVEHDGVRGSNQHYSRMIDVTMLDFTKQLTDRNKLSIINTVNLDDRVKSILSVLNT
jgi:predicted ATPase